MTHRKSQNSQMNECIEHCRECADICLETISYCLGESGEHAEKKHIVLLQVCADICETSTRTMLLDSELHQEICNACAVICDACADSCESFKGDPVMKTCAEICRRCAVSCRSMVGPSTEEHQKADREMPHNQISLM